MKVPQARESEITDETIFLNRRDLLRLGATATIGSALAGCPTADEAVAKSADARAASALPMLSDVQPAAPAYRVDEKSWKSLASPPTLPRTSLVARWEERPSSSSSFASSAR